MIAAPPDQDVLYPLSLFCRNEGRALPAFELIDGAKMPEPYASLLVHHGDMTSRLEEFHASALHLRVLHCEATGEAYRREVLLCTESAELPVEYGAIEIQLGEFSPKLRELILAGQQPLGGLLNEHGIRYRGEPRAFIRLTADATLNGFFGTHSTSPLYGRSNVLRGEAGQCLARIVEVLRPREAAGA